MRRRDFVKGLAAAPLAMMAGSVGCSGKQEPAASTAASAAPTYQRLHVVVHGTFLILADFSSKQVNVMAPYVPGHTYKAKTFKNDATNCLVEGWDYTPAPHTTDMVQFDRGAAKPMGRPPTGDTQRLIIDVSTIKPGKAPYWSVNLPLPDDIWPLRSAPCNYLDCTKATFKNNGLRALTQLPLIYVLQYTLIPEGSAVTFGKDKVPISIDNQVGRLHLFAETAYGNCDKGKRTPKKVFDHLDDSLLAIDALFEGSSVNLSFDSKQQYVDKSLGHDQKVNYAEIMLCEERTLDELTCYPNGNNFNNNKDLIATVYCPPCGQGLTPASLQRTNTDKPPRNCVPVIGTT